MSKEKKNLLPEDQNTLILCALYWSAIRYSKLDELKGAVP